MYLEELRNLINVVTACLRVDVNKLMNQEIFESLEESILIRLEKYSNCLKRVQNETEAVLEGIGCFRDIYYGINEYLAKRAFGPLAVSQEYKEFFGNIAKIKKDIDFDDRKQLQEIDTYLEQLLNLLIANRYALYNFEVGNHKIVSSNLVFEDDCFIPMNFNYAFSFSKRPSEGRIRYGRPIKVEYQLESIAKNVLENNVHSGDVISQYSKGGFDKLCPDDIKDMAGCRRMA